MLKILSGLELLEMSKNYYHIPTGSRSLDRLLAGGIRSSTITNIYGLSGSGKTQLSLELLLNVIVPNKNFPNDCMAVYATSKKCFYRNRLEQLMNKHKRNCGDLDFSDIMKRILYKQFFEYEELSFIVHHLYTLMTSQGRSSNKIRLIVIDSFSFHIRNLPGFEKVKFTYELLNVLSKIATEFNVVVMLTCDMSVQPIEIDSTTNEPKLGYTPALGETFLHRVNQSIQLERQNGLIRITIRKSLLGKLGSCKITIDRNAGLRDVIEIQKRKSVDTSNEDHVEKKLTLC